MINQSRSVRNKQIDYYSVYCKLVDKKKSRKEIMKELNIPYWKIREYEVYYFERTKKLTFDKYIFLSKRYKDEQIRKHYKIPVCEFNLFLEGIKDLRKI